MLKVFQSIAGQMKSTVQALPERLQSLLDENKLLTQELKAFRRSQLKQLVYQAMLD